MNGKKFRFIILIFICSHVFAWDSIDFELFDLVEDVKTNFYEILGVSQGATAAEIRRAYRKLSLQLHPDRSDDPDAEVKFRNLVAVSEVLKDDEKRKRYDNILRDGLPDWRQPVFYYRRVRKMGMLEFLAFIFGIFTVGHFIVAWSIYLEKKFELDSGELISPGFPGHCGQVNQDEYVTSAKKKKEKRNRKLVKQGGFVDDVKVEEILNEEGIHKPTFWDLLPFVLYRLTVSTIKKAQQRRQFLKEEKIRLKLIEEEEERERERAKEAENLPKPKRRRVVPQPAMSSEDYANWEGAPVTAQVARNEENHVLNKTHEMTTENKEGEWNEEDLSKLSRLMVRYPGGTPGRWEKVACDMGRSVKDITKQVKQTKSMYKEQVVHHSGDVPKLVPSRKVASLDDNIVTQASSDERNGLENDGQKLPANGSVTNHQTRNTSKVQDKGYCTTSAASTNLPELAQVEKNVWSQNQQKLFEKALASVAKDVPDRWTQISRHVPGKTKEECIARYKFLVEILKGRKRGDTDKNG